MTTDLCRCAETGIGRQFCTIFEYPNGDAWFRCISCKRELHMHPGLNFRLTMDTLDKWNEAGEPVVEFWIKTAAQ